MKKIQINYNDQITLLEQLETFKLYCNAEGHPIDRMDLRAGDSTMDGGFVLNVQAAWIDEHDQLEVLTFLGEALDKTIDQQLRIKIESIEFGSEDEDMKDVWMLYGATVSAIQFFEVRLLQLLMELDGEAFDLAQETENGSLKLRKTIEELRDSFFQKVELKGDLRKRLDTACEYRDWIAFHAWKDRGIEFQSFEGRGKIKVELEQIAEFFINLEQDLAEALSI